MRKRFTAQLLLNQTPIENVEIPEDSRDELPPVLKALQWIFKNPIINEEIFLILESRFPMSANNMGRPGMDLWHILVLGVVRLALGCDYDRLEYLVHYDTLLRQIMGLGSTGDFDFGSSFHQKTINENVCHVDEEMLMEINQIIAKHGRNILKKKADEKLNVKADTYVEESNVHFPTDLNLSWDACRKSIILVERLCDAQGIAGWRKSKNWAQKIKSLMRECSQIASKGGSNKTERLKLKASAYLDKLYRLENKVNEALKSLNQCSLNPSELIEIEKVKYFHDMLIKHIDLIDRRILKGEEIPHHEKLFSLFEPHTEWINKGKSNPSVELGHKILIATEQNGLILDYKVMEKSSDVNETVPLIGRLLDAYGEESIDSFSVDKGFSCKEDRELIEFFIPVVVMPKKGRLNQEDKKRESQKPFKLLRNKHSAIESNINSLEHHGLNRCPDKGIRGFKRYTGLGVLAYNLNKIGKKLIELKKAKRQAA